MREFQVSTVAGRCPTEFMARVIAESRKVPARVWRGGDGGHLGLPAAVADHLPDDDHRRREGRGVQPRRSRRRSSTPRSGARLHLEPGIGHTIHWEAPERFVELAFQGRLSAVGDLRRDVSMGRRLRVGIRGSGRPLAPNADRSTI